MRPTNENREQRGTTVTTSYAETERRGKGVDGAKRRGKSPQMPSRQAVGNLTSNGPARRIAWVAVFIVGLEITPLALATTFQEPFVGGGQWPTAYATVNQGETHTFRVDVGYTTGIDTDWYLTNTGGSVQEHDDNYSWTYYDPQFTVTFNSTGTQYVRAEMYNNSGTWVQAQRWRVTVVTPNRAPYKVSGPSPFDGATNRSISTDLDWSNASDPDGDTVTDDGQS